jgi:hypothetical protein
VDHRWGQRKTVHVFVHVRTSGGLAARGDIVSVSISGALIKTPLPAPLFSTVVVCFGSQGERVRIPQSIAGQVVRRTAEGVALEWCELAPDVARALGSLPTQADQFADAASGVAQSQ